MTVAALVSSVEYNGNGVTTGFAAPFRYLAPANLLVEAITAAGVVTTLVLGGDYSATPGATDAGGSVTCTVAPAVGTRLRIKRVTPRSQSTDYTTGDDFPAEAHETALDRAMLVDQEQDDKIDNTALRALLVPDGEIVAELPAAADRAGYYLAFGVGGTPVRASGTGNDAALRADLAASGGAALSGYVHSAAGAVPRSIEARLREEIWLTDFLPAGYVSDGSVDYSTQIRAAIAAQGHLKNLRFPQGAFQFRQDGANPWGLQKYASNRWIGDGQGHTVLYPFGLPDACDGVHEIPSPIYLNRGGGASNLAIQHPTNGTRSGRHGWHIDTTMALAVPDLQINGHRIEGLATGTPTAAVPGYGLCHTNDAALNTEGGMYASKFSDLTLGGGFCFLRTGDSITLEDVRTWGPLPNYAENVVNAAGSANTFKWARGNATNVGGILQLYNAPGFVGESLDTEAFYAGPGALNGAAAIWLKGPAAYNAATNYVAGNLVTYANRTYRALRATVADQPDISVLDWIHHDPFENVHIHGSLLSISGAFDGTHVMRIDCGDHVTVDKNRVGIGLGGVLGFSVQAGASHTDLRRNTWTDGVTEANKLTNAGSDTMIDTVGAVVQAVSKSTAVVLDTMAGTITTHNAALAANTPIGFQLTNALIGAGDTVSVAIKSGPASGDSYLVFVDAIAAGSCRISLRNMTVGALAEAVVISFKIHKARD